MSKDNSKSRKSRIFWRVFMVCFYVLVAGLIFAFGDYYRQFFGHSYYGQQRSSEIVQHDTKSSILRRFEIGAVVGAVLGISYIIRDIFRKNDEDDDA